MHIQERNKGIKSKYVFTSTEEEQKLFQKPLHQIRFPLGGFPSGSDGKESACNTGDLSSAPGLGRFPGEEKGNPL